MSVKWPTWLSVGEVPEDPEVESSQRQLEAATQRVERAATAFAHALKNLQVKK